ncbi:MAG: hypothetical protein HC871_00470, partial [Rhizobiales bacterium]|nr:hypothetical protein [Hyphomicrobiales bacterium]
PHLDQFQHVQHPVDHRNMVPGVATLGCGLENVVLRHHCCLSGFRCAGTSNLDGQTPTENEACGPSRLPPARSNASSTRTKLMQIGMDKGRFVDLLHGRGIADARRNNDHARIVRSMIRFGDPDRSTWFYGDSTGLRKVVPDTIRAAARARRCRPWRID